MDRTHAPSAKSNLPKIYLFTTSIFTQHPILQKRMCGSLPSLFNVNVYRIHMHYVVCKWRQFQSVTHCNTSRLKTESPPVIILGVCVAGWRNTRQKQRWQLSWCSSVHHSTIVHTLTRLLPEPCRNHHGIEALWF